MIKISKTTIETTHYESDKFIAIVRVSGGKFENASIYKNRDGNLGQIVGVLSSTSEVMGLNDLLDKIEDTLLHGD